MATLQPPFSKGGLGGISVRPEPAPVVLRELRRGALAEPRPDLSPG